ncbi:superoxide dismutase [Ni] [Ancylomarina sp. 16SWW S1-10-2]|uniref:superoxide dismutase [Ni] n=1 Tax=Ancylomarina sp. 16SWW S1-10-2 TaxID=2499681 RepID=UPI0012ADFFCF|nr:superoxide dismutase [Ni] [Ancylomarina sp. 16SWW S1-10-2]MRT92750.1 superoxide dismutase [Ancylomarina sp. 16SWW S1-10-2]
MKKIKVLVLAYLMFIGLGSIKAYAHCEIPCGIYNDKARVELMYEHIQTIEKSMKLIIELSAAEKPDYNQLVRWINNKEEHANKLQTIATQYFMFQRVKVSEDPAVRAKSMKQLELLHKICVYAMQAKQSTNIEMIKKLNDTVHDFSHEYLGEVEHKH